jgi:hypothetical protein
VDIRKCRRRIYAPPFAILGLTGAYFSLNNYKLLTPAESICAERIQH